MCALLSRASGGRWLFCSTRASPRSLCGVSCLIRLTLTPHGAPVITAWTQFEPMGMGSLFARSVVITGIFLFPIWLFLADDYKYQQFQAE
jgi:hypothetical protein